MTNLKKIRMLAVSGALLAAAALAPSASAVAADLNVYNWSDYIAPDTIPGFTKQTGVKVKYDNYDTDETLQAKMLAGNSGYDIVVPTSNYMAKQIQAGVYRKLDKSKLPNLKNLDPVLMKMVAGADPDNAHGVPWAYGTDGIGYNVQEVEKRLGAHAPVNSWQMIFDPAIVSKMKSCGVSVLDQAPDLFSAALQYMGKDPNSTNPADYQAAYEMLKKVRPYITQFNSSGYINDLANKDLCLSFGFSGDVGIAARRAADAKKAYQIKFQNAKEGGLIWFDVMVIPADAQHADAALKWINYIEDPQVNAAITNTVFYPTANLAARKFVKPAVANDPGVYPSAQTLSKMTLMKPLPLDIMRLQNRLWTQLKSGI